ncbi:MAG TPA: SRPBCC domain-containing protein [Anseongella sp.]|nr:SRPBCC domain-containing protein [Anseongella sp.]
MPESYIDKKIAIQAPVAKVWNVLVKKQHIQQWIYEFSASHVATEDWQLNTRIAMTDNDGTVLLEGTITEFEPPRRLKVEFEASGYIEELSLTPEGNLTLLYVHAGPVSPAELEEHSKVWEKGLNKIKELAEAL